MSSVFSAIEIDAINRDTRAMTAAGFSLASFLSNLSDDVAGMSAGSTAAGVDIDSMCLGGGEFTINTDTTAGLTLGYNFGRIHNGYNAILVGAGTVALAASTTNYVEVDRTGAVSSNTAGFTSGRMPLYTVATGVSTIPANSIVSYKPFLTIIGPAGVTGTMLTTPGATKHVSQSLGTIEAGFGAVVFAVLAPNVAATVTGVYFSTSTAVAANDGNYWTFTLVDTGPAGTGSAAALDTAADNSTRATGGAALVANVARALVLNLTGNLPTLANDVLLFTAAPTGAPASLAGCAIRVDFQFVT